MIGVVTPLRDDLVLAGHASRVPDGYDAFERLAPIANRRRQRRTLSASRISFAHVARTEGCSKDLRCFPPTEKWSSTTSTSPAPPTGFEPVLPP
jgi:hypothetical protein